MIKKIRILYSTIFLFILMLGISDIYSYNLISNKFGFQYRELSGDNITNYDGDNEYGEDIKINTGYNGVKILQVGRYEDDYINSGLRILITGISDGVYDDGFFVTNRFGRFEIAEDKPIKGFKKDDVIGLSTFCPGESIYYSLSGSIFSFGEEGGFDGSDGKGDYWGKMSLLDNESYFCPGTKKFNLSFDSDLLGKMSIFTGSIINEYLVEGVYGDVIKINSINAFDNKKVFVNGILSDSDNYNINTDTIVGEVGVDEKVLKAKVGKDNIALIKSNINKNIEKVTRGLKPINLNENDDLYSLGDEQVLEDLTDRKLFYYNYEGLVYDGGKSNEDNEGVILKLGTSGEGKIGVSGDKTLIVKGGNLYIDTNIYNRDNKSLLTIVVKRDDNNNGGNVYISPLVTNIDAIIIADGSLLSYSYSSNRVMSSSIAGDINRLRKQLLIYGSVSTKNTIGKDIAPYGSDTYIKNGGSKVDAKIYNFDNLRSFEVEMVSGGMSGDCSTENKIRAIGSEDIGNKYLFAGKKECYIDDIQEEGLRGSEKIAPVLLYYNPNIKTITPMILRNN